MMPVFCLMGPTATGKTALSLRLAQRFPIEIISVDSAMVYRGLDIGSGKPTLSEQASVPHHLIDIRWPADPYNVAEFRKDALAAIHAIHQRGKIPFLVGGTMLYFKILQQGLSPLPGADEGFRRSLEARAKEAGWEALHQQLMQSDPQSAEQIRVSDPQRIMRALEVHHLTGIPLSSHFESGTQSESTVQWHSCALMAENRQTLHQKIAERFYTMCANGFIEEVERLKQNAQNHRDLPAIRSVGYRQIWEYLEQECDKNTMEEKAIAATRQLAKRQMTWLRRWPSCTFMAWDDPFCEQKIADILDGFFI